MSETPTDTIRMNGYRIHVFSRTMGAFYRTELATEVPALVMDYYCSICARTRNGASRDGEEPCEHKALLRFAVACLDDDDEAAYYRELAGLQAAVRNGTA